MVGPETHRLTGAEMSEHFGPMNSAEVYGVRSVRLPRDSLWYGRIRSAEANSFNYFDHVWRCLI